MDTHRRWSLVMYLATYFLSISMIYQMSPFFQPYAVKETGASAAQVGLIFAALPFASFAAAIPGGRLVSRLGPKGALTAGLLLLAGSTLGFGLSRSVGGWVSWRLVQGVATAPVYTAVQGALAQTFSGPGEFSVVNGYLEVVANLGFTVGPILGGTLFQWGGFQAPFLVSATLHVLFVGLSGCAPSGSGGVDAKADTLLAGEGDADAGKPLDASRLCYRKVMIIAGVTALVLGAWGALEPVLANHFHATLGDVSDSTVGMLFALPAVFGTVVALIIPRLSGVVSDTCVMVFGIVVLVVGLVGFGIPLPDADTDSYISALGLEVGSTGQWALQLTSMAIVGCGFQIAWTPCLPSLMDVAAQKVAVGTGTTVEVAIHRVSAAAASIFNAAAAIGEAAGPIFGGILVRDYGFEKMAMLFVVVLSAYALMMIVEDSATHGGVGKEKRISNIRSPGLNKSTPMDAPQIHLRAAAMGNM